MKVGHVLRVSHLQEYAMNQQVLKTCVSSSLDLKQNFYNEVSSIDKNRQNNIMTPLFLLQNVLLLVSFDNSKNKCFTLLVRTLRRLVSLKY